ncbi:aldehyde dehydrogenase family protein [Ottowia thiooxydans]|uniref:Succinate-semialdehyde dehydrogenase/glutarate-semialdehyde dehydrogenase n=1 Tax=Ottowia thiooxydans TaxID=219182 RepID=A0ABV2Q2A3_9BURK
MSTSIPIRNPRTGQYDFNLVSNEVSDLPVLADELRANQTHWESIGLEGRLEVLNAWRKVYLESYDEILASLVADTGRLAESQKEMQRLSSSIDKLTIMAREVFQERAFHLRSMKSVEIRGSYHPFQVVGVISPWNFPLSSSLLDTIPALVAGCAAIVKPSEITPRFVKPLVKTIQRVPEMNAVLRYVQGDKAIGEALIAHADAVCFTGSVQTGQKVAEAAARAFIPAFLELGGKDPAIVTESAHLDAAAASLVAGATSNAGQVCVSIERIYVARPVMDKLVQSLVEKASAVKIAYPTPDDGALGPIILERQAHEINRHLEDALSKGAKIQCGGMVEQRDGGWYAPATVVTGVDHSMVLMTEETFGPIMPVMAYDTVEEAVALANDSSYGLSGAVFAGSADEAMAIARRIQVGAVSINSTGLGTAAIGEGDIHEKNSFKRSGLAGSRLGYDSITRFMRKKAYLVQH